MINLPDVQQSTGGFYKRPISKVGVRNMMIPLVLDRKDSDEKFHTIAKVSSYCNLTEDVKGINMSRISRTINDVLVKNPSFSGLEDFVEELRDAHQADDVYIKAEFPYIYKTLTPITNIDSMEPFDVVMESVLINGEVHNYLTITTVEMSLCPCSKEMSLLLNNLTEEETLQLSVSIPYNSSLYEKIRNAGFGAHNQKSYIKITVEVKDDQQQRIWLEDLLEIAKSSASCRTWSTLKRPDEKYVTEVSYMSGYYDENKQFVAVENGGAKFVEDIARHAAYQLDGLLDQTINDYVVVIDNAESIHSGEIMATAVMRVGRNLR